MKKLSMLLLFLFSLFNICLAVENKELGLKEIYSNKNIGVYVFYCYGSVSDLNKAIKFYDTLPVGSDMKAYKTVYIFYNKQNIKVDKKTRYDVINSIEAQKPNSRYFYTSNEFKNPEKLMTVEMLTLFDETGYPKHNFTKHNRQGSWQIEAPSQLDLYRYYKKGKTDEKNIN